MKDREIASEVWCLLPLNYCVQSCSSWTILNVWSLAMQDTPAAARRFWKPPRIEDLPEVPAAPPICPPKKGEKPDQGRSHERRQPDAAEAHRQAAVPNSINSNDAHAMGIMDATDEHSLGAPEQAPHMACSEVLDSSTHPSAAVQVLSCDRACALQLHKGTAPAAAAGEAEAPVPSSPPSSPPSRGAALALRDLDDTLMHCSVCPCATPLISPHR